jgi:hypothetical protein
MTVTNDRQGQVPAALAPVFVPSSRSSSARRQLDRIKNYK